MATVTKDFRIKSGLVVEGANGTVNGSDIITEDIITGGTQTNIAVTYNPGTKTLDFVAENGVADSTTDDLTEGATNQYFTDERAQDAAAAMIVGGTHTNVSVDYDDANNVLNITGAVTYTDEDAQDAIGAAFAAGVADPHVTVTYDDAGNAISVSSDATSSATASTIVSRDATGGFSGNLTGSVDINGGTLTNLSEPINDSDAATKFYVDSAVSGLNWKEAVNLLADTNVELTGTTGTLVIDGHSALDVTDNNLYRVLLTAQTIDADNGIYLYTDDGSNYTLVRSDDADTYQELDGAAVFVQEGTSYGATSWVQSSHYMTDFTGQSWTQFSGQGTYTAGNNLQIAGNEFSLQDSITLTGTVEADELRTAGMWVNGSTIMAFGGNLSINDDTTEIYSAGVFNGDLTGNVTGTVSDLSNHDTADLTEGTNLYFTDARAVSALQGTDSSFSTIDIDTFVKQIAATAAAPTNGSPYVVYSFDSATYRSAKFLVKVAYGTHTEVSEVLLTLDTSNNIAITEYAVVGTNGGASAVSAGINAGAVELIVTPVNDNSTVTVMGTLLV